VNQTAKASQVASEPVGHENAPGHDTIFDNEDACLRVAQNLYYEECKRSHHLQEQINTLEAVLENIEGSLAQTKEQMVESDTAVISKYIPLHLL